MTNFLEHSYTSSRAKGGYFTIQYSHGLSERDIEQLEKNGSYRLPDSYDPRPEENKLASYPIQFNVYRLEDGRRVFGRSVYRGRDNHSRSARPGNYYNHSLVLADRLSADKVLACEVYYHASDDIWEKRLQENKLGEEPRDEIVNSMSLPLKGDAAAYIPIIELLLKEDRESRLFMLARIMDLLLDGVHKTKRIVIIDEDKVLPTWICTLTLVLPPRFYEAIHFSSFYADPKQGDARVVCSVEDCAALFARSGDAEIIQKSVKNIEPKHNFTRALIALLKEIMDAQDMATKKKKWENFMSQIAGVKTLGVDLDREIMYYTEMIGSKEFNLTRFEEIIKRYPNKEKETKDKMFSIYSIRMEYFDREIKLGRILRISEIIPYLDMEVDSGELNRYAHMLATEDGKSGTLERIKDLYSRAEYLGDDCKFFIKTTGLDIMLQFGKMKRYDEKVISQIEQLSPQINEQQRIKLNIFWQLCKLSQSKDSDVINSLFRILEERKKLKEEDESGLKDDIYDFLPVLRPDWLNFLPDKETEIWTIFYTLNNILAPPAGAALAGTNAVEVLLHYLKGIFENESVNQKFYDLPEPFKIEVIKKINNKNYHKTVIKDILWPFLWRNLSASFEANRFVSYLKIYSSKLFSQKEIIEHFFTIQGDSEGQGIPHYAESLLMHDFFTWKLHEDIITYFFSLIPKPDKSLLKKFPEYVKPSANKEDTGAARLGWFRKFLAWVKKKDTAENDVGNWIDLLNNYTPDKDGPSWTWLYLEILATTAIMKEDIVFSGLIKHFLNDKRYKKDGYDKKYCCIYIKSIQEFSDTTSFISEHSREIEAIFDEKKWCKFDLKYNKTEMELRRKAARKKTLNHSTS